MTIKQAPAISSHTAGDVSTQTAETRPPTLVVWGKNDPIFLVAGAESYKKDLTTLEFHPLDAGLPGGHQWSATRHH